MAEQLNGTDDEAVAGAEEAPSPFVEPLLRDVCARLQQNPGHLGVVLEAVQSIDALGYTLRARRLFQALGLQAIQQNRPLDAAICVKRLAHLQGDANGLLEELVAHYSKDAADLARGTAPLANPPVISEPEDASEETRRNDLVRRIDSLCQQQLKKLDGQPSPCSPIPLMSDLAAEDFRTLIDLVEVQQHEDNTCLVGSGQRPPGIWWLVDGTLRFDQPDLEETATLNQPHLLVGLECLFDEPAMFSVSSVGRSRTLFLPAAKVSELMQGAQVREQVRRLVSRYELHQAVARSELFRLVPVEEHPELLARFTAHRIAQGHTLVKPGAQAPGLFFITHGRLHVSHERGRHNLVIKPLHAGDLAGSLGHTDDESSPLATIAAVTTRLLFLNRSALREAERKHPSLGPALARLRDERRVLIARSLADIHGE